MGLHGLGPNAVRCTPQHQRIYFSMASTEVTGIDMGKVERPLNNRVLENVDACSLQRDAFRGHDGEKHVPKDENNL